MKSERVTFMKVTYNGEKHYLERFPDTFQQLTLLVMKKCKMASIQDLSFYLIDSDGEHVVVNSDSDIEHIRSSLQLANESTAKVYIERRASKPTADAPCSEDSTNSPPKDSFESKYYDYLKHNLGSKINKQFETHLMFDKLPCKLCHGSGQRGTYGRCNYCNDTGSRPLTKKWKLILALIEYKIKEYVMNPLAQYLGKPKEEFVDNVLSCLDDGTSDSEIDDLDGSYEEEAFPLDESFIVEKATEEEYSRRKKSSQGSHKNAKDAVDEPLKDPQKRPEEKEVIKKPDPLPPLRKTSAQITTGNSQTNDYRPTESPNPTTLPVPIPTLTQSGLVQVNRQTNDWGNKNLMNLNPNSVNQSSVNQNSLSNMGSFMNSTDGRSSTFQITTRKPGDLFSSGFQNQSESGNNTFQSYQVKTYKSKGLDFEWLDAKEEELVHQSNDYLVNFRVKNTSTTVWKKGLIWLLSLDGKTEAFVHQREVSPGEEGRVQFHVGKYNMNVLDVENMYFHIKWTDEEENCKYFSEKKYVRIIFVK